jgi:hypothetical protein
MAGTWTEDWDNFGAAGTGWQNYDIYTNKGIPKGAVVYIVCCHGLDTTEQLLGVRTDGSSLSRYVDVHECETSESGTAYRCVSMYVTVHATSGYIETYVESTTQDIFYIMGYWEGVTYTEKANSYSLTGAGSGWTDTDNDRDYYTLYSVPKGAVCEVYVGHSRTTMMRRGIRTEGSSVDRQDYFNEVEDGGYNGVTWIVKTDTTNGEIREYCDSGLDSYIWSMLLGYFNTDMDFSENYVQGTFTSADTWAQHWDLTSYIAADEDIVHMQVSHNWASWARYFGVRVDGSTNDKRIYLGESETGRTQGFSTPCPTDAQGEIEAYTDEAANDWIYFTGYYIPPTSQDWTKDLSENITPTNTISQIEVGIFKSQTINPTVAISKALGKIESESITPTSALTRDFYLNLEEGMKRILRWVTP